MVEVWASPRPAPLSGVRRALAPGGVLVVVELAAALPRFLGRPRGALLAQRCDAAAAAEGWNHHLVGLPEVHPVAEPHRATGRQFGAPTHRRRTLNRGPRHTPERVRRESSAALEFKEGQEAAGSAAKLGGEPMLAGDV